MLLTCPVSWDIERGPWRVDCGGTVAQPVAGNEGRQESAAISSDEEGEEEVAL